MFHRTFAPSRDSQSQERAAPLLPHHHLWAVPTGGDSHLQPPAPSRLGGSTAPAASSSRPAASSIPGLRYKAAALPAYRALLGGRPSGSQRLPHVLPAAERPAAAYTSLDGLRKMAELAKGKHSTVCSYLDTRSGQLVVVKTYYKRTMAKRHHRNVRREISINKMLAKQRFTGTVQQLGAFEDNSHIYLVQESCGGGDLYRRLVRSGGLLAEADVCRDVVVPLLLTLTFLHASHVVHRDIKPENIMFTADGGLRLGDFGLSIDAATERPTSRVGTLDYMAPEVVGMPSPDDIQRLGLAPAQVGHYGCKVDVWAVGILCYELICGRPPFEVEDVKLTEQRIKFAEVAFPPHLSPLCRSFIQQALTKRPEGRPTAAQLFQHPWVRAHYRQLLAGQAQLTAAAAAAATCTPELRRTSSQPPSPSKSMPGGDAAAAGGRLDGRSAAATPAAVAALAPFLPLSQARMAHKVRLLSPSRPPSSSRGAARLQRRVSDPLGRVQAAPLAEPGAGFSAAAAAAAAAMEAAAAAAAAAVEGPPSTPGPAAAPAFASDGAGAVAAAGDLSDDAVSSSSCSVAQSFETPGTPGLKTTPLNRSRPVVLQQRGPLGRTPFLLPALATPGGGSSGGGMGQGVGEMQPLAAGGRKVAGPMRSRFAAAAENGEAHLMAAPAGAGAAALALRTSGEGLALGSPGLPSRAQSFTSLSTRGGGSSSASSPAVQSRAQSFTSFGGSSSGNLTNILVAAALPAGSPSPKQRPGSGKQQLEGAGEQAAAVEEAMQRLRLLQ